MHATGGDRIVRPVDLQIIDNVLLLIVLVWVDVAFSHYLYTSYLHETLADQTLES